MKFSKICFSSTISPNVKDYMETGRPIGPHIITFGLPHVFKFLLLMVRLEIWPKTKMLARSWVSHDVSFISRTYDYESFGFYFFILRGIWTIIYSLNYYMLLYGEIETQQHPVNHPMLSSIFICKICSNKIIF